jgi:phage shock protein C
VSEPTRRRLYRSRTEKMLSGVSGGLGDYFEIDPVLIRLAWVALTILSGGAFILAYLVLWIILPREGSDYAGRETVRSNFGEVADEARAWAGEVRGAFRPDEPISSSAEPGEAVDEEPSAGTPVAPLYVPGPAGARNRQDRHIWAGAILILIGLIFLLDNLNILPHFNWGVMWPLLLVLIGGMLLWQRGRS